MFSEIIAQSAAPVAPAVNPLVGALMAIISLGSIACWVIEIVNAFKKEEKPLMGILSIVLCGLGGFIIGWINAKKWGIQKIMMIWTVLVVVGVIVNVAFGVSTASAGLQAP